MPLVDIGNPLQIQIAFVFLFFVFVSSLLWWMVLRVQRRVKAVFKGSGETEEDLKRNVVRRTAWLEAKVEELDKRMSPLEDISHISVQKVGFLRFNPFQDTGGDNSFAISLLDRNNDGVVFSSFYTREGVRVYAKKIENGTPKQPLSDEEKKVLDEAMKKTVERQNGS